MKKQNHELQKSYTTLEYDYNESNEKYQELYNMKLKIEKDFLIQQSTIEQERNAKTLAFEKIQELEGEKLTRLFLSILILCLSPRKIQYHND